MKPQLPLFLLRFLSSGITPGMSWPEARRIRLMNIFYLVGSVGFIAAVIETFAVDGKTEGYLITVFALLFNLGLVLLLAKRTRLAEAYFFIVVNLTLFVFENRHGPAAGSFFYYPVLMLTIAFLVDFRKFIYAALHLGMTIAFLITGIFLRYKFLYKGFPAESEDASFLFNLVVSSFLTAVIAIIMVRQSYDQYNDFRERIEERKRAEELMKMAIREKETLLAEVHHRVKNNLAVISGLLNLQMNVVKNEYTREVLQESRNRVASMALIHQKLYQDPNVEQINFSSYAGELISEIRRSYPGDPARIRVQLEAEQLALSLTKAVPCGLILNELLSNCYKHAFPGNREGTIFIRFFTRDGKYCLDVEDDGNGLPDGFNMESQETLGMTIIQSLAEQLDTKAEISGEYRKGARCRIVFKP